MSLAADSVDIGQTAALVAQIGALPDAPLAMPKQRLERTRPVIGALYAALLRPFVTRTSRGRG